MLLLLAIAGTAAAADPSPVAEDDFTARIAGERANAGLAGYTVAPDLVDVARRHAEEMARQDRLFHNPRLATEVKNWESVGENVGTGESVADIHRAFMESSTHRSEILNRRFTQVGVGVVERDGLVWVAQVFRKPTAPASAPAPAPAPAPSASPAPAPRASTTTTDRPVVAPTQLLAPTTSTTTTPVATTTTSTSPAVPDPTAPAANDARVTSVAGSSVRSRSKLTVRDVTVPITAASGLLVLVVGALALQVGAESRRAAGVA